LKKEKEKRIEKKKLKAEQLHWLRGRLKIATNLI